MKKHLQARLSSTGLASVPTMVGLIGVTTLFAWLPSAAGVNTPGPEPVMTTSVLAEPTIDAQAFKKKYQSAMRVNSKKEMERLVRVNLDDASIWIIELAYGQKVSPNPDKLALFDSLKETWNDSIKTEFPMEMWRFFDAMDRDATKEYNAMVAKYDKLVTEYFKVEKAEGGPDPKKYTEIAARFETLAEELAEFQCVYYESQAWSFAGFNWDDGNAKEHMDLNRACMAYHYMLQTREEIGLLDSLYKRTKPRYLDLVARGYGPGAKVGAGPEAEAGPDEPVEVSDVNRIQMEFALLEDPFEFKRPNYLVDEHYPLWLPFFLADVGSETPAVLRFAPMWERSGLTINARRQSSAKIYIDVDGDRERTEVDVEVPLKGKMEAVHVEIQVDGKPRHQAFWAQTGQEKDQYQNLESNLAGNDNMYGIYATPGGSMQGMLDDTLVRIIDEDMDGVYGGKPLGYLHVGMTKDSLHTEFDTMLIGSSKRAVPFSRYAKIDKQWYDLKSEDDGTVLAASKVELQTGELKLKFKGPKPTFLVLQGTGTMDDVLFDLVGSSTLEVPTGEYRLLTGMIAEGKKKQLKKILIVAGEGTPTWTVTEGKTTEVALGGPFGFDFKADVDPKGCQVIGDTVCIIGAAGERYERPWLCKPRPLAAARVPGNKRGSKPQKMPITGDTMEVAKKGWNVTWFPKDLAIDVKGVEGAVEVQLTEKKHSMFGKITSEWLLFD